MKSRGILLAALTAGALSFAGSSALAQVSVGIGINIGPPALRHEVVVARPAYDAVWVHGHWGWRPGPHRYAWVPGRWIAVRPGYDWVDGRWAHGPRGWIWREGNWHARRHERTEARQQEWRENEGFRR